MTEHEVKTVLAILGMTAITVLVRSFFFISDKPWRLPAWVLRGLQYAPVAALTAVIAPDILWAGQGLSAPWRDARVLASLAAALFYVWRRNAAYVLPASIGVGMLVYLPLHLGLGW